MSALTVAAMSSSKTPESPSDAKLFERPVLVIAIAGGSGSGKTTVSEAVRNSIGDDHVAYISHDSYYKDLSHLPVEERAKSNFDHPESLDSQLFVNDLQKLRSGKAIDVPLYDFSTHTRISATKRIEPRPVILIEGILIFAEPDLRELMDIKIFVDAPADIRLIRRIQRDQRERGRDAQSVILQYLSTVRPMDLEFVQPSKRYADVIIPKGGRNKCAVDMVISRIHRDLQSRGAIVDGEWTPSLRASQAEPAVAALTL